MTERQSSQWGKIECNWASFNRRQWLRLFPAWTAQERRDQLEVLADAGGEVGVSCNLGLRALLAGRRSFSAGRPFVCRVSPSLW